MARRGANVIGVDIASGLLDAARVQAEAFQPRISTAFHAGFSTDLGICVPRDYWPPLTRAHHSGDRPIRPAGLTPPRP